MFVNGVNLKSSSAVHIPDGSTHSSDLSAVSVASEIQLWISALRTPPVGIASTPTGLLAGSKIYGGFSDAAEDGRMKSDDGGTPSGV